MNSYKIICIIAFVYIATFNSSSIASPWASPGDSQLRADVELLAHHGLISGPVNSWPMSWKQITRDFYKADAMTLPAYVQRALERVQDKVPGEINVKAKASYTNKVQFFRGFEDEPRSKAEIEGAVEMNLENTSIHVEGRYLDNDDFNLDNSYISQELGNWSAYAGTIDRWWGPGQETTTLLSTNARPMASIGIRRVTSQPFKTKWLSWMGPWDAEIFVSKMEKARHIPKTVFVGMRFNFEPIDNFEVGLGRTLMLCGEGRRCGFKQWTHGLVALGDLDNIGPREESPGNQLAMLNLSYSFMFNNRIQVKIYAEGTAEDIVVAAPYTYSRILGATFSGALNDGGDKISFNTELSDTTGSLVWFFGEHRKGVMYNHSTYRSGYRYFDRVIGHSLDSNSFYASAKLSYLRSNGLAATIKYQNILINSEGDIDNHLSSSRERVNSVSAEIYIPSQLGGFKFRGNFLDNEINTLLGKGASFMFLGSWELGF